MAENINKKHTRQDNNRAHIPVLLLSWSSWVYCTKACDCTNGVVSVKAEDVKVENLCFDLLTCKKGKHCVSRGNI